jgi:hypothetical protein
MDSGIATQLITVGATLSGVVLTLAANNYLEIRRARESRELESLHIASEDAKWLRDERVRAYAGLSLAAEEVLQFIRAELPMLIGSHGAGQREETEARWAALRTELRKAYNQVALFGAAESRAAALQVWRTARNGGNDYIRDLDSNSDHSIGEPELSEQIKEVASRLGTAGDHFLETCRTDLQGSRVPETLSR